jgi:aldehyde:ferredoxin oxidoreductase
MELMNNYKEAILVIDLEKKECETEDLTEELVEKALGGAAINMELYEKYKDRDPLIIGTGFFTGTFMPAGCGGVITGKSPITGKIAHVPFGIYSGVELKLTGFDFIVILGKADSPVRLWLHDGLSDVDDSSDIWGKDVWESTDKVREIYGDEMIQVLLIGPAGENKVKAASISENYWGSNDNLGLGAVFGEKNLKAICLRGLDSLEVAEGFFAKCMELKNEITGGTINGKAGLKDIAADLGIDAGAIEKLNSATHRNNAGYNCPYPTYTYLKYREAPNAMEMIGEAEPGCLITNIAGFAGLNSAGLDASEAIEKCYRLGIYPAAAAKIITDKGASDISAIDAIVSDGNIDEPAPWPIAGNPDKAILEVSSAFSTAVPPKGIFANQDKDANWWINRQAIASILGIDPVIMLMTPEITEEKLVELIQISGESEDFSADDLKNIVSTLIEKSA